MTHAFVVEDPTKKQVDFRNCRTVKEITIFRVKDVTMMITAQVKKPKGEKPMSKIIYKGTPEELEAIRQTLPPKSKVTEVPGELHVVQDDGEDFTATYRLQYY